MFILPLSPIVFMFVSFVFIALFNVWLFDNKDYFCGFSGVMSSPRRILDEVVHEKIAASL